MQIKLFVVAPKMIANCRAIRRRNNRMASLVLGLVFMASSTKLALALCRSQHAKILHKIVGRNLGIDTAIGLLCTCHVVWGACACAYLSACVHEFLCSILCRTYFLLISMSLPLCLCLFQFTPLSSRVPFLVSFSFSLLLCQS